MFHLTKGFGGDTDAADPSQTITDAFTITGEVDILTDTRAEADTVANQWQIGFVQVLKARELSATYEGRRDGEGEIFLLFTAPPAWPAASLVSLDSDANRTPFVNTSPHVFTISHPPGGKFKVHLVQTMGDHPWFRFFLRVLNNLTKAPNFLFTMTDFRDFFSVLMARDERKVFRDPIAHVHWSFRFLAKFKWARGQPIGTSPGRIALTFDPLVKGGPADPAVRAIVDNPVPPHYNDVSNAAARQAGLNRFNKQDSDKRSSLLLPRDFFR
jgi:hypothetical protein